MVASIAQWTRVEEGPFRFPDGQDPFGDHYDLLSSKWKHLDPDIKTSRCSEVDFFKALSNIQSLKEGFDLDQQSVDELDDSMSNISLAPSPDTDLEDGENQPPMGQWMASVQLKTVGDLLMPRALTGPSDKKASGSSRGGCRSTPDTVMSSQAEVRMPLKRFRLDPYDADSETESSSGSSGSEVASGGESIRIL